MCPTLTIPNTFVANTTANASEVNANFNAVATLLNSTGLDSTNIQTGGVATANLADASVTTAKLASTAVPNSSAEVTNLALAASVASNNLTISLKGKDGNDPSSTNIVKVGFRSATASSGVYNQASITSALSVQASSGASLGATDGDAHYIYVYLQYNSGSPELVLSGNQSWDEGSVNTTTTISAAATSGTVLYGSTGRASQPIRLIGRVLVTESTAGVYASAPSEISLAPFSRPAERSVVTVTTPTGYGSSNTRIVKYGATRLSTGTTITYTSSATNGDSFTINEDGLYMLSLVDSGSGTVLGFSVNSTQLSTDIDSITAADRIALASAGNTNTICVATPYYFAAGDVVRAHGNATASGLGDTRAFVTIMKMGR